jgi:hypothetical protein
MAPAPNFFVLCSLLFSDSDFIVSPNYIPGNNDGRADFIVSFEITLHQHRDPVLVLQVKPPQHVSLNSTRGAADSQTRRRLVDLAGMWHRHRLGSHDFTITANLRACAPLCPLRD